MRKRLKKLIISACGIAVVSSIALASLNSSGFAQGDAPSLTAGEYTWESPAFTIEQEYAFGTIFNVPNRSITAGGKTVKAQSVLQYPNGDTTLNTAVKLNVSGTYKLRYTASVNGKNYLDEYEFFVVGAQASVNSEKSSISYGAYSYDVDRMALVNNQTGETERQQYTYACEEGLMVRLARGDSLTFHEIIDLSNTTELDSLVRAFATPDEQGSPDFEKLIFTFTDVYNPSIQLSFVSQHTPEGYDYRKTYSLVSGNGQKQSGLDFMDSNKMYVGKWGMSADGSFSRRFKTVYQNANGVWVDDYKEQDAMPIDFRYDSESKTAFVRDYRNATRINKIADLDNPEHFDSLWSGFTDGKVRLSISADVYSSDTANFCVTHVRGLDLSQTEYRDVDAPVLKIENDYEKMPTALVGGSYPVPSATAFDLNAGACKVKTSVWYNYTGNSAKTVEIKNGRFETKQYGDYAIVYEADDGNGNLAKEILWVRAEKQLPEMQIVFTSQPQTVATCGDWVLPADYEVVNAIGKETDVKTSVKAIYNGEEKEVAGGFRPEKHGEYQIVVTATDYIGRTATSPYAISVNKATAPVFIEKANLPLAFISGMEYVMPNLSVSDYTGDNLVKAVAYAELTDKNGTRRIAGGERFVPAVAKQGDTVKIVYKYEYQGNVIQSEGYVIPAIVQKAKNEENKTRLFISNYMIGGGFTTETKKGEIVVTSKQADGAWTFAKELIAEGFSLKLRGAKDESLFDGLRVTIRDSLNASEAVSVYAQNLSDSIMFYLNGETVKVNNALNEGGGFTLGYSQNAIAIGSIRMGVDRYDNGEKFKGFTSNLVFVSVAFDGAEIGAKYSMENLCGEVTGTLVSDSSSPFIAVLGDYGGLAKIGEVKLLPEAIACDLLDPNVSFTMSVTAPNATILTDVNGKQLKDVDPTVAYNIRLEQAGQYMVRYTAVDSVGNENSWSYPIIVKDEVPPTLSFKGETSTTAKMGDTLILPDFSVADNVTSAEKLVVTKFVYTPSGKVYQIPATGNSIVCSQAGVYEFRIMVMDEEGNLALYTYSVTVS